jgi:hypothetical protein
VINTIARELSRRPQLSVPRTIMDVEGPPADADVLVSEHVLVRDGKQPAFFHEWPALRTKPWFEASDAVNTDSRGPSKSS